MNPQAVDLAPLAEGVPMCECGKRLATVPGPDGKTRLCLVCARRLAQTIRRQAKVTRRRKKHAQTMAIPKTRRLSS